MLQLGVVIFTEQVVFIQVVKGHCIDLFVSLDISGHLDDNLTSRSWQIEEGNSELHGLQRGSAAVVQAAKFCLGKEKGFEFKQDTFRGAIGDHREAEEIV